MAISSSLRFQHQPDNINSLSHNTVYSLLEDSKGELWIGTGDGGLSHFDQPVQGMQAVGKNKTSVPKDILPSSCISCSF